MRIIVAGDTEIWVISTRQVVLSRIRARFAVTVLRELRGVETGMNPGERIDFSESHPITSGTPGIVVPVIGVRAEPSREAEAAFISQQRVATERSH